MRKNKEDEEEREDETKEHHKPDEENKEMRNETIKMIKMFESGLEDEIFSWF